MLIFIQPPLSWTISNFAAARSYNEKRGSKRAGIQGPVVRRLDNATG